MENFRFRRGYGQVQQKDIPKVREELMQALGVNNKMSLSNYMRGMIEPKVGQVKGVEEVFARYGIADIWGD